MFLSTARQTAPASHFLSGRIQLTTLSRRAYSTPSRPPPPPPPPSSNSPHTNRSHFKILPILAIIGLGSGSYVLLVKSRTGANKNPRSSSN
ncbi:hypothetical protein N7474_003047 [Penicillium riverlandense]|uniref:uncharacterized protein n=1 Tax=Penicillium riverlandense TaxID=1903569 RepID=UPI002546879C|nr:uncharacterized protein N7474_003047 [Penicillium riverlandense]KAJ5825909.1 hypothetical protein N7474_003047 [Penicillium riverlandense]